MITPILAVDDVDRSIAFYTDKLGFKQEFCLEGPDGQSAFGFVSFGEEKDAVYFGLSHQPDTLKGGAGVVLSVYLAKDKGLDAYYEAVRGRGVKFEQAIATQYWGDRNFALLGPDGYYLSFSQEVAAPSMESIRAVVRGES